MKGTKDNKAKSVRVEQRKSELTELYKNLAENKKKLAYHLINNAAFMEIALEDLQKIIAENGASEEYKNGANQYGKKASADLQSYNALIKSYNMISQRLEAMLPEESKKSKLSDLMNE